MATIPASVGGLMKGSPCLAGLVFSASLASRYPRPAPSCHTLSGSFREVQGGNGSVTGNGKRGGKRWRPERSRGTPRDVEGRASERG